MGQTSPKKKQGIQHEMYCQVCSGKIVLFQKQNRLKQTRHLINTIKFTPMDFTNTTGVFSPDGRLYQVEYAQRASEQGSPVCANIFEDKIYVFYENRQTSPLQIPEDKIRSFGKNMWGIFSGIRADSYRVESQCINEVFNHKLNTAVDMQLKLLAGKIGAMKQKYTVKSGYRPIGLKTMLFGFEEKAHIFVVEADGNYAEYDQCSVGHGAEKAWESFGENTRFSSLRALLSVVQHSQSTLKGYVFEKDADAKEIENYVIAEEINKFIQ